MANRKVIKKANERFHIANFIEWFNKTYHSDFVVISEPEPPEAIIQSSAKTTRWIEISNAFWNGAYAKDLTSFATSGETHEPMPRGPYGDMDKEFSKNFVTVLKNKLEKTSYQSVKRNYGKGYLIIPIYNPFFDSETVMLMEHEWRNTTVNNLDCFRSVRIAYQSQNKWVFKKWRL